MWFERGNVAYKRSWEQGQGLDMGWSMELVGSEIHLVSRNAVDEVRLYLFIIIRMALNHEPHMTAELFGLYLLMIPMGNIVGYKLVVIEVRYEVFAQKRPCKVSDFVRHSV